MATSEHQWRFFRAGGFDQVLIETGEDLEHLGQLDPKLWTVLTCPIEGLEFDRRTLSLLDTNNDGQVRVSEIQSVVHWCCERVTDSNLFFAAPGLPIEQIAAHDEEGQSLKAPAQRMLTYLEKDNETQLQVSDFADTTKLYAADHFNGDGVVVAALTDDEAVCKLMIDIVTSLGGVPDRCGENGVDETHLNQFFEEAQAIVDWHTLSEGDDSGLWPLGEQTPAAMSAFEQVRDKIEDFMTRCQLAVYDTRAVDSLNPDVQIFNDMRGQMIGGSEEALKALPLAMVNGQQQLPLTGGVNPAWAGAIKAFKKQVVEPLLQRKESECDSLSAEQWMLIKAKLAPFQGWLAKRPDSPLHELGLERLRQLLAGDERSKVMELIMRDREITQFADNVATLEKLTRCQRDLVKLLRNFVSLTDFYIGQEKAIFQIGTLYIDQRSCELVIRVDDPARHNSMASYSGCYLVYCRCTRSGEKPLNIVAALTSGDVDYSMIPGRNGVFYDRQGRDWHALVTKVVAQPISIRQAFWTPYKRVATFVETQINKMAASRDKDIAAQANNQVTAAATATTTGSGAPSNNFDIAKFAGIFAAIGLAIAAIGSALMAVGAGLLSLKWWQTPLAVIGMLLLISAPSMVMAWLTLRRRNLGPLLDANGWAINTRALINNRFGTALTGLAKLPKGSRRRFSDPYRNPTRIWWLLLALALTIAYTLYSFRAWIFV